MRGEGAVVWDDTGREYIDATGGALVLQRRTRPRRARGGGRPPDARARVVPHVRRRSRTRGPRSSRARIAALAPVDDAKVFLTRRRRLRRDRHGRQARARVTGTSRARRAKQTIVSRSLAYHGVNAYGTSLGGIPANAAAFGRLVADVEQVAWDDADALAAAIERLGAERVAAFICEPVVGAGGVLPPPTGYLERVEEICRANGVLLIADEVVTGFGRTGASVRHAAVGREGGSVVPLAKGISSGYVPLGATAISSKVAASVEQRRRGARRGHPPRLHLQWPSGGPAAAALATLEVLEREDVVGNAARQGAPPPARAALRPRSGAARVSSATCAASAFLVQSSCSADVLADRPELTAELRRRLCSEA